MSSNKSPIEHLAVLMMEYLSYDYMLRYLSNGHERSRKEYNQVNPVNSISNRVYVSNRSGYITTINPSHAVVSYERQVYGEIG